MASIYICVTVDWEGNHFKNVSDLAELRKLIEACVGKPVPFTHFICPNYWLNGSVDPEMNIAKVCRHTDEIGLHVHAWQKLVQYAKKAFLYAAEWDWDSDGTGHGIPLGMYPRGTVEEILVASRGLLMEKLKLPNIPGFRCGGWVSCDAVIEALMRTGFAYDCSAVPPVLFSKGFSKESEGDYHDTYGDAFGSKLAKILVKLWGYERQLEFSQLANTLSLKWNANQPIHPETQPYKIFLDSHSIIELPNNGGLSDYVTGEAMCRIFFEIVKHSAGAEPVFFNIGCHQEGPFKYKKPLLEFFESSRVLIRELSEAGRLHFSTVLEAARSADLYMVD